MSAGRLAEALAEHRYEYGDCGCSDYELDMPYADHLAVVVLDLLGSDEVREAVQVAVSCGYCTDTARCDMCLDDTPRYLAAIRGHLTELTKGDS